MADNVTIDSGSGGPSVATDDIASAQYQRIKLIHGADGVNDGDISKTNPLPVGDGIRSVPICTAAEISIASSGDNTIVSGTASQTIRVHSLILYFHGDVSIKIKDSTPTTLFGTVAVPMKAYGSITLDFRAEPWFKTASGKDLIINLSAAVQVTGLISYIKDAN